MRGQPPTALSLCVVGVLGSAVFACLKGGLTWSCSGSGRGQEGLQARGQASSLAEVGLEWHPLLQALLAISG